MNHRLIAYIGLGSNLGDRQAAIQGALDHLAAAPGLELLSASQLYECPAWGYASEFDYLNAVVKCSWDGPPLRLQELCYKIEAFGGRHRAGANPPRFYQDRSIDLDLLYIEGIEAGDERLTLPHPRAHLRGFVLVPLAELAPELVLHQRTVAGWLESLDPSELAAIRPVANLSLDKALN